MPMPYGIRPRRRPRSGQPGPTLSDSLGSQGAPGSSGARPRPRGWPWEPWQPPTGGGAVPGNPPIEPKTGVGPIARERPNPGGRPGPGAGGEGTIPPTPRGWPWDPGTGTTGGGAVPGNPPIEPKPGPIARERPNPGGRPGPGGTPVPGNPPIDPNTGMPLPPWPPVDPNTGVTGTISPQFTWPEPTGHVGEMFGSDWAPGRGVLGGEPKTLSDMLAPGGMATGRRQKKARGVR